jgi:predicted DNA-binding protein (MmcQ/YjbR family)
MFADASNHHGGGRPAVWCKAAPGNQELMTGLAPRRFFKPPYVGPSGWIGIWLDGKVDWAEVADLLRDSYLLVAPKKIAQQLVRGEGCFAGVPPHPLPLTSASWLLSLPRLSSVVT